MLKRFSLSEIISFLLTSFVWTAGLLSALFIPLEKKKNTFNEIQITLSKPEVKNNTLKERAEEKESVKKVPTEKTSQSVKEKSAPVKKAMVREEKLYQSVEDIMKAQNSSPKKNVEWDESLFSDAPLISSNESSGKYNPSAKVEKLENALQGSAGKTNETEGKTSAEVTHTTSTFSESNSVNPSDTTKDFLKSFENTASANALTGTDNKNPSQTNSENKTSGSGNKENPLNVSDGRRLLFPTSASIMISADKQKSLQNIKVKFQFTVNADGSVNYNSIKCTTGAVSSDVEKEIREQIARWKFEKGSGSSDALFDLIITAAN